MNEDMRALARLMGVACAWTDHEGVERHVAEADLRRILAALGAPCDTPAQRAESRARALRRAADRTRPPLLVAQAGARLRIPVDGTQARFARLVLEDGRARDMRLEEDCDGHALADAVEEPGYHRLEIDDAPTLLAIAPARCFTVENALGAEGERARAFGLTAQIHALRTQGDGGAGTFAGVRALAQSAARAGADALALSPSHAQFTADPHHYAPYSPSSRLFLNAAHIDHEATFAPARIAACADRAGLADLLPELEARELIDWPAVAQARRKLNAALFEDFMSARAQDAALHMDFDAFRTAGGQALADHATFEALHAHYFGDDPMRWSWRTWESGHRDPRSARTQAFAQANAHATAFHAFLQWLAARSLTRAQARARSAGMRIGLISDLAVGVNAGGSQAWSRQGEMLEGVSIGAPPDPLAPLGQNWGLAAFSPQGLRASGYDAFRATLRATMHATGGVRIDHALGLMRLWLTPDGEDASHGAYVAYPFEDLLGLVRLESHRARAIVIAEDLGTVPPGLRERLAHAGAYGMRVLQFERDDARFARAEWYARDVVAMTSTHDTPTMAGWRQGRDIGWRDALSLFAPGRTRAMEEEARGRERAMMAQAFAQDCPEIAAPIESDEAFADAATLFISRTRAALALVPLEDVLAEIEQPNLPGTVDEHPNWRRRCAAPADAALESEAARCRLTAMAKARGA
jgi:4-alpha-glucanotransferase